MVCRGQEFFDVEVEVPGGLKIVTNDGFATKKQLPLRMVKQEKEISDQDEGATKGLGNYIKLLILYKGNTFRYCVLSDIANKPGSKRVQMKFLLFISYIPCFS